MIKADRSLIYGEFPSALIEEALRDRNEYNWKLQDCMAKFGIKNEAEAVSGTQ